MTFVIADKIAHATASLDWLKNSGSAEQQQEAAKHLTTLSDCAIQLAGERAHELYGPDDGSSMDDAVAAARQCTCGEES